MDIPGIDSTWARYLDAEDDCIRAVSLKCLDDVIAVIQSLSEAERTAWARERARQKVDEKSNAAIRFPLFRDVLFPALLSGIESNEPGCARWLAGLSQLLYQSDECRSQLPSTQQTEMGLLLTALQVDPNDYRARSQLIREMSSQLDYSIHELPAGVLYGHNGATIDQCADLQAQLEDFQALVIAHGIVGEYIDLIAECEQHYIAYPAYLAEVNNYESYADYLAKTGAA
jgi:hypothetical protein